MPKAVAPCLEDRRSTGRHRKAGGGLGVVITLLCRALFVYVRRMMIVMVVMWFDAPAIWGTMLLAAEC